MIITLKVTLVGGGYSQNDWTGNLELDESSVLEDLHEAIQAAVNFDNDHLYCFFLARTEKSQERQYFDDENGLFFNTTLKDLFPLPEKRNLFYLFDWGDNWIFKITRTRKGPQERVKGVKYPRVESESGTKPVQYQIFDQEDDE